MWSFSTPRCVCMMTVTVFSLVCCARICIASKYIDMCICISIYICVLIRCWYWHWHLLASNICSTMYLDFIYFIILLKVLRYIQYLQVISWREWMYMCFCYCMYSMFDMRTKERQFVNFSSGRRLLRHLLCSMVFKFKSYALVEYFSNGPILTRHHC